MTRTIRDLMTTDPVSLPSSTTLVEAARQMSEHDIGDVLVCDGDELCGIVTDRDIVVRGVADACDITTTTLGDVCSSQLVTVEPTDSVDQAVRLMSEHAIRRLPVVEAGRPIGILAIGDLAVDLEPSSALGEISSAPADD